MNFLQYVAMEAQIESVSKWMYYMCQVIYTKH